MVDALTPPNFIAVTTRHGPLDKIQLSGTKILPPTVANCNFSLYLVQSSIKNTLVLTFHKTLALSSFSKRDTVLLAFSRNLTLMSPASSLKNSTKHGRVVIGVT